MMELFSGEALIINSHNILTNHDENDFYKSYEVTNQSSIIKVLFQRSGVLYYQPYHRTLYKHNHLASCYEKINIKCHKNINKYLPSAPKASAGKSLKSNFSFPLGPILYHVSPSSLSFTRE